MSGRLGKADCFVYSIGDSGEEEHSAVSLLLSSLLFSSLPFLQISSLVPSVWLAGCLSIYLPIHSMYQDTHTMVAHISDIGDMSS